MDIGYKFDQMVIFFIPILNRKTDEWCAYIGTDEWALPFDKASFSKILPAYDIQFPDNPKLPFWDALGGKLLLITLMGSIIYFSFIKNKINISKPRDESFPNYKNEPSQKMHPLLQKEIDDIIEKRKNKEK